MSKPSAIVLLLAIMLPGMTAADQTDPRLDELFEQLKNIQDPYAAQPVEAQIWAIWVEHENADYAALMTSGIRHMNANALTLALADFDRLGAIAPDYAEAWNKRATVHYLLQNFAESEADIARTLALEPFHFGALSGLGLVNLAQGKYLEARGAFQKILEFYPAMPGIRNNLQELEDYLRSRTI